MGLREIILLVCGFGIILYIASMLKEWFNPETIEESKSDEEYAKESIDELIVKEKDATVNKDDTKK